MKMNLSKGLTQLYEAGKIPASTFAKSGNIKWTFDTLRGLDAVDLSILSKDDLMKIYKQNYSRINRSLSNLQKIQDEHYIVPSLKTLQKKIRTYKEGEGGKTEFAGMKTVLQPFKNPEDVKSINELKANVGRILNFVKENTYTVEGVKEYNKQYTDKLKRDLKEMLSTKTIPDKDKKEVEKKINKIDVTKLSDFWRIFNKSYEIKGSIEYGESEQRLEYFKSKYLTDLINGNNIDVTHTDILARDYLKEYENTNLSRIFDFNEDDM